MKKRGGEVKMEIEDLVEKAKSNVVSAAGDLGRKWLEANIDSYGSPNLRIRVLVLEGSGPRGIVIVNYYLGKVHALGADGEVLSRYSLDAGELMEWRVSKLPNAE